MPFTYTNKEIEGKMLFFAFLLECMKTEEGVSVVLFVIENVHTHVI